MGSERIKAAVIGMGPHGRRIVDVVGRFPRVELTAVVDRQASALNYEKLPASTARLSFSHGMATPMLNGSLLLRSPPAICDTFTTPGMRSFPNIRSLNKTW